MLRRVFGLMGVALLALGMAACHRTNKKVENPLANVGSKQPDKVLFDRAMDAMKHNKYDVARLTLQTLINTYPDSEYIARAKLAVGDSWYAEGGSTALAQAENEYKDFQTFFPNMVNEASEAQLKIANIHYRQMEKADRDYTHAKRAEDEYRQLIQQYPDSKLIPEAKQHLMEVQEVLAQREFLIGRFYFMRESWAAAMARLQSLVDTYPLFSNADEALFLLGSAYERQIDAIRATKADETTKGRMIQSLTDKAAAAYSRIVTRYPVTDRAEDAKKRLQALHRPVPKPTPEAVAQNKAEEESRTAAGRVDRIMMNLHRHPDTSMASKVGDPTLVDPKQTSAPELVRQNLENWKSAIAPGGSEKVSVEAVKGAPPASQPPPRSDAASAPTGAAAPTGVPELQVLTDVAAPDAAAQPQPGAGAPLPPPPQINEAAQQPQQPGNNAAASSSSSSTTDTDQNTSSSKKKKKKGLKKLNPF